MFGIRFIKVGPTTHVMQFVEGRVRRQGAGLAFYYFAPVSTVVAVPLASTDVPFAFAEVTADFQEVSVQGQLTYRVADPARLAAALDFSIRPDGRYASNDPEKLNDRLLATAQVLMSAAVHRLGLRQVLVGYEALCAEVLAGLKAAEGVALLGVEVLALSILAVRPTPAMAKALEAEAREALQRQSDEAIYARRNAAVESERRIKESELNTEILVEEKRRQKREAQVAADIAVEQQRTELVARKAQNDRTAAEAQAYALEAVLRPVRDLDWRTLMAVSSGKLDARTSVAMAFRDLAENAGKIGELNITPDLLGALVNGERK